MSSSCCLAGWADGRGRPLGRLAHVASEPLVIGFNDDQLALIADLRLYTTADARVLWDETPGDRTAWNWSALLPLLTDRPFLGGSIQNRASSTRTARCAAGS